MGDMPLRGRPGSENEPALSFVQGSIAELDGTSWLPAARSRPSCWRYVFQRPALFGRPKNGLAGHFRRHTVTAFYQTDRNQGRNSPEPQATPHPSRDRRNPTANSLVTLHADSARRASASRNKCTEALPLAYSCGLWFPSTAEPRRPRKVSSSWDPSRARYFPLPC